MAMTIDEMIAVLQAYKDGKAIEYRTKLSIEEFDIWQSTDSPCWNFSIRDYRVKPEPTRLEVANKFWKDTFSIDNAFDHMSCPIPSHTSCEVCELFDACRYEPIEWWNAPYKEEEVTE